MSKIKPPRRRRVKRYRIMDHGASVQVTYRAPFHRVTRWYIKGSTGYRQAKYRASRWLHAQALKQNARFQMEEL